jgi:hypothetical protein
MTTMHQKQSIEDTVQDQVIEWNTSNPIDVYLSSGYGPALKWKLYEFRPKSRDLLGQFQYFQNRDTQTQTRVVKYSPPLGILKLDSGNTANVESYLDRLLEDQYLENFGWDCFQEESQIDATDFQATLLVLMCQLYIRTTDNNQVGQSHPTSFEYQLTFS